MRAADAGTWERVRQLAAQDETAPLSGAGSGPARPLGPAACERCADAAGRGSRPRAGAPFVRADGDCSQPGRCAPGGESGAAAGLGSRRGRARGGAPGWDRGAAGCRSSRRARSRACGAECRGDARDVEFVLQCWGPGSRGSAAFPPSCCTPLGLQREVKAMPAGAVGSPDARRPSSGRDLAPVVGSVGKEPAPRQVGASPCDRTCNPPGSSIKRQESPALQPPLGEESSDSRFLRDFTYT